MTEPQKKLIDQLRPITQYLPAIAICEECGQTNFVSKVYTFGKHHFCNKCLPAAITKYGGKDSKEQ